VLSARARRDVRAFGEAVFSRDGGPPPDDRMRWFVDDVDDFVAHLNLRAALLFRLCLFVASWLAPLFVGRLAPLASLPVADRIAALDVLERTPASLALFGARAVVSLCYYEHPDAAAELGWDRKCLTVVRAETSRRAETSGPAASGAEVRA
jgi:hypothetical protein